VNKSGLSRELSVSRYTCSEPVRIIKRAIRQQRHIQWTSPDYQESYPSTVLFLNCHGVALFMDGLQSDVTRDIFSISNLKYVQRQLLIAERHKTVLTLWS
jgi:hypothetical protein